MNNIQAQRPIKPRELYRYKRAAHDVLMIALFRNKMNPAVLKSLDAGDAVNAIVTLLISVHQAEQKQNPARSQGRGNLKKATPHTAYRQHRARSAAPNLKNDNTGEGVNILARDGETCAAPE